MAWFQAIDAAGKPAPADLELIALLVELPATFHDGLGLGWNSKGAAERGVNGGRGLRCEGEEVLFIVAAAGTGKGCSLDASLGLRDGGVGVEVGGGEADLGE